ncbi:MAG: DUF4012 domain-containing protein [Candidatus Magasanikbacteria bacterium]
MLANDSKNKRKCSVCRKLGHDKRKCPKLLKTENKISTRKSPVVLVKVGKLHKRSPHLVDLRIEKKEDVWGKVNVYRDESVLKQERRVMNLAEMVKQANMEQVLKKKGEVKKEKEIQKVVIKKERIKFSLPELNIIYHLSFIIRLPKKMAVTTGQKVTQVVNDTVSAFSPKRFAYGVVVILLLITAPFPAIGYYNQVKDTGVRVVEESTNAFLSLQSSTVAVLHSDLDQAQYDLNSALVSFGNAGSILEKEHRALQFVAGVLPVIGTQINSRQNLLVAGHHLALGNTYLIKGVRSIEEQPDLALTDKITILASHLRGAIPQYQEALLELGGVDSKVVPVEYQQSFNDFKFLFTAFVDDMQDLLNLADSVETIFGADEFRRYLLVFQNNNEIRPTGGFMGSFAILDMQKGRIVNLDIPGGGTYDLQGQLDKFVKPPLPLQLLKGRWEFQDANWFSDFPASAEKMAWFYEHGRGATVDGVIAINATVLERLLKVLGPVANENYDLTIASDNVLEELQYQVEVDYDKEINQPKAVLGDLAGQFLARFGSLNTVDAMALLSEANEALQEKEIQIYFKEPDLEEHVVVFGWAGEIRQVGEEQDYLQVVNTNIAGEKTDATIEQTIEHQAEIQADGSVINTVVIHRQHTGIDGEQFYGQNNINYIRILVPEGSELIEAGGFTYPPEDSFQVPEDWYENDADLASLEQEVGLHAKTGTRITNQFGKTAYGNWMMTAPGKTSNVYFKYRLPFKLELEKKVEQNNKFSQVLDGFREKESIRYSLLIQKQSGINSNFSTRIIAPNNWIPVWQTNEEIELAINGAEYETILKTDEVIGLVMEKNNSNQ